MPPLDEASPRELPERTYARFAHALEGVARPYAFIDEGALDRNIDLLLGVATAHGKPLRVATKSIRCPDVLGRIHARAAERLLPAVTFMTYTARETALLAGLGLDHFLLAYPVASRADADVLAGLTKKGTRVSVVVDDPHHLAVLSAAAEHAGATLDVIVEVDMAYRPVGSAVHLGVRRSPLRTIPDVLAFVSRIERTRHLGFAGIMGYEAQIAGVGDAIDNDRARSTVVRALRSLSRRDVETTRKALVDALVSRGTPPRIVNGGGTGNLAWCAREPTLTETTAGSGFLCGHLFDRYRDLKPEPCAYFALDVVRHPAPGIVTCAGGGFVASGPAGDDRLPIPALPRGLSLLPLEGAGEVQTPLRAPRGGEPRIGSPVFFRHAKAGELAEHFTEYGLVSGRTLTGSAKTYRGLGHTFLG